MKLERITLWLDRKFRTASEAMALDHAILEHTIENGEALLRLYRWDHPAVTIGYFQRAGESPEVPATAIRRFTGGGMVEHGEDITFALTLPAASEAAKAPSAERHNWIHANLAKALGKAGVRSTLNRDTRTDSKLPCFQQAVSRDLVDPESGRKIGGGAQRRSRGAVIHQGSVRIPEALRNFESLWIREFGLSLASAVSEIDARLPSQLATASEALESERYGNAEWNRNR